MIVYSIIVLLKKIYKIVAFTLSFNFSTGPSTLSYALFPLLSGQRVSFQKAQDPSCNTALFPVNSSQHPGASGLGLCAHLGQR